MQSYDPSRPVSHLSVDFKRLYSNMNREINPSNYLIIDSTAIDAYQSDYTLAIMSTFTSYLL